MSVLMMFSTIAGLFVAAILLIVAFWKGVDWLKKFVLGAAAIWFVFYAAMLFGFSLLSEEKTCGIDEPKKFCGFYLDCHLHSSVSGVKKTKTFGNALASGEFYVVKVKISSNAKRAVLNLTSPQFYVTDAAGKSYHPVENPAVPRPPFDDKLKAGGSFEREIVFDLPLDIENPRLDIREGSVIERVIEKVLIGDEDSLFHQRIRFSLEQQPMRADL